MAKKYDWKLIENDVLNDNLSFSEIAEKHGIDRSYLHKQAKKRNWTREKSTKSTSVDLLESTFISDVAKDRYYLTKDKMGDVLTIIDDNILIPLVNMYARMIELEGIVKKEGVSVISPKTGAPYQNPNYNALLSATKSVASLGKELGLTVSSRKRVGISQKSDTKEESIFDKIDKFKLKDYDNLTEKVSILFKDTKNVYFEMILKDFDCTQTTKYDKTILEFSGDPLSEREQTTYNVLDDGLGFDGIQKCFYRGDHK